MKRGGGEKEEPTSPPREASYSASEPPGPRLRGRRGARGSTSREQREKEKREREKRERGEDVFFFLFFVEQEKGLGSCFFTESLSLRSSVLFCVAN